MRTTLLPGLHRRRCSTNLKRKHVARTHLRSRAARLRATTFDTAAAHRRPCVRHQRSRSNGAAPCAHVDFFDVKGDLEALAAPLTLTTVAHPLPALHPGRSARVLRATARVAGWLGELHPRLVRHFDLPDAPIVFELDLGPH